MLCSCAWEGIEGSHLIPFGLQNIYSYVALYFSSKRRRGPLKLGSTNCKNILQRLLQLLLDHPTKRRGSSRDMAAEFAQAPALPAPLPLSSSRIYPISWCGVLLSWDLWHSALMVGCHRSHLTSTRTGGSAREGEGRGEGGAAALRSFPDSPDQYYLRMLHLFVADRTGHLPMKCMVCCPLDISWGQNGISWYAQRWKNIVRQRHNYF